jgi:hypothetical protein
VIIQDRHPQLLTIPPLVLAGDGREQVLGEGGQTSADAAKLCRCHCLPPVVVAGSFQLG